LEVVVLLGVVLAEVLVMPSVVLVELEQGVVGLAVTQEHMLPTAPRTSSACAPQPLTTHERAVFWIADELAHWHP